MSRYLKRICRLSLQHFMLNEGFDNVTASYFVSSIESNPKNFFQLHLDTHRHLRNEPIWKMHTEIFVKEMRWLLSRRHDIQKRYHQKFG